MTRDDLPLADNGNFDQVVPAGPADRLARNGRPATARVVGTRTVSIGEETGAELTLRISGPEVAQFETTHRSTDQRDGGVGDGFPVVVDPADNVFMILPRRVR